MSYEGYTERLCLNGHYWASDVYCQPPKLCKDCGAAFRYTHGVDQTNGYDESHPSSCDAPKIEIGHEDVWHMDPYLNRYATIRPRFAPVGEGAWVRVNSKGQATPPYPDDLAALAIEAGTATTTKIGVVHESAGPKDNAQGAQS